VYADDVRARLVMLQLRDLAREQPALASGRLAVLVDHDRRHNTTYIETLRAHLDSFGDVRAAAATLTVHPNTLRYRVRRLQELSGLDLEDPVERLVAQLQLHLAD
jgi:DNA-binding PucR family transcriptional regulator